MSNLANVLRPQSHLETKATKTTLTMFSQPLLKKLNIDFCCVYTVASSGESWVPGVMGQM